MRYTQQGNYVNDATITDGAEIDASGVLLTNSSSGRIVGGVEFLQGGSTVTNELGGIVRVADIFDEYSVAAVTGSNGADTFINQGLVRGLVRLGDGNDRYVKGPASIGSDQVDLGAGDDVIERIGTSGLLAAQGGEGFDRVEIRVTDNSVVWNNFNGFEELVLTGNGQFVGFSGYQSIKLGIPSNYGQALIDSANPLVDLALAGNSIRLHNSTLRSVTGSAASERLEMAAASAITAEITLGAGDDELTLSGFVGASPTLPTTGANGGEGVDLLSLWSFDVPAMTYDLAGVRGFENLHLNIGYRAPIAFDLANAEGFGRIALGLEASLTVRSSYLPGASLHGGLGGSILLDEGTSVAWYDASVAAGFPTDINQVQGDDTLSLSFSNEGQVLGDIAFSVGDDVYDGRGGLVGGIVYGNAGNDRLIGGSAAEHFEGGYGADQLFGGGGADILVGGAGNDIFGGTIADLAADLVRDFTAGDRIRITDASLESFAWEQAGISVSLGHGASLTVKTGGSLRLSAQEAVGGGVDLVFGRKIVSSDSSGDGFSDLVWRNADGSLTTWNGTGGGFDLTTGISSFASIEWRVIDAADFNGDGRADLLWRHQNGTLTQWASDGSEFSSSGQPSVLVARDWQAAGTGDFNGDGRDDILWRNDDGRVTRWLAADSGFDGTGQATLAVAKDWHVAGNGDFDGDGRDDILWRNNDGRVTQWLGTADSFNGAGQPAQFVAKAWQVSGVGDFNGDGKDDILWRASDGSITRWVSNGNGFDGAGQPLIAVDDDWRVAAVDDYNGDGFSDILWRHVAGTVTTWDGGSGGFNLGTGVSAQVDPSWSVLGG